MTWGNMSFRARFLFAFAFLTAPCLPNFRANRGRLAVSIQLRCRPSTTCAAVVVCSRSECLRDGPLALSLLRGRLHGLGCLGTGGLRWVMTSVRQSTIFGSVLRLCQASRMVWIHGSWGSLGFTRVVGPFRSGDSCTGVDVLPYGPPRWPRDARAPIGRPREWLKPVCSTSGPPPITASGAGCLFLSAFSLSPSLSLYFPLPPSGE